MKSELSPHGVDVSCYVNNSNGQNLLAPAHGGPDALGVPLHDFSTNANACGPCPDAAAAVAQADASRYPDPAYTALRAQLAAFHGVAPGRVLLAASASEFIARVSAWVARQGRAPGVWLPAHHYGDYAHAARAWGLVPTAQAAQAVLLWACEPCSPLGLAQPGLAAQVQGLRPGQTLVLDCAYAPLRLSGAPSLRNLDGVWQLWTPNKALGLTGVRAAYAIAPADAAQAVAALQGLGPSWPLGAHGVALLQAWLEPAVQDWLAACLPVLRDWKAQLRQRCAGLGWAVAPSDANYLVAHPRPDGRLHALLDCLRRDEGIKLRECSAFGLPGHLRLGVLPPASQQALVRAVRRLAQAPANPTGETT